MTAAVAFGYLLVLWAAGLAAAWVWAELSPARRPLLFPLVAVADVLLALAGRVLLELP